MALATVADVEAALGRPLLETEDVEGTLEDASDLVIGYLNLANPDVDLDPVPDAVVRVVATVVANILTRPQGLPTMAPGDQLGAGQFSMRAGGESVGPWLTRALKLRLRPYRRSAVSVPMSSEAYR